MKFISISISGAFEILLNPISDERGQFTRLFCEEELSSIGFAKKIVQVNHSLNRLTGTIRGMHYQLPPFAEIKIIRCMRGRVFDVIIDIRKNSPSFLKWQSIELSPEKSNMIYIPEGCAHGFQTLEENSELLYFHTAVYKRDKEAAIRFDDPTINIQWPLPPLNISEKDLQYALLKDNFTGIAF